MYKDRNNQPHLLSYSSVTNYPTPTTMNNFDKTYDFKQSIKQSNHRVSLKVQPNNDLAFLRNTMGPKYFTNHQQQSYKLQDKSFDSSLRQTTGNFLDIRQKLKLTSPLDIKRSFKTQADYDGQKFQRKQFQQGGNRLQKIMDKYEKKNQTKQALKLLQQLKELKKKQQQLKKNRKNQNKKQQDALINKNLNFDCNSPVNFSKKNKVEYFTPTTQKKQLSTKPGSPQHDSYISSKRNSNNFTNTSIGTPIYEQTLLHSKSPKDLNKSRSKSPINYKPNYDNKTFNKGYSNYLSTTTYHQQDKHYDSSSKLDKVTDSGYRLSKEPVSPMMSKKNQAYESYNNTILNSTKDSTSSRDISKSPNPKVITTTNKYSSYSTEMISQNTPSSTSRKSINSVNQIRQIFSNRKVSINDFILGKNLGEGKFGVVYQAYDKKTKSIYALKKVPKSIIKSHWMVDQFVLEVKLQAFVNHPNILSLVNTFDDNQNVYILLEYMQEGTLFLQLKKNQILDQREAAIKLKQIASAVQYLHQNNIAHRDIKPENIVMSHGVCKLCDFGWATICDERRKTYCGTFDYAAPEILEGTQYDMTVDLWCLGILAYEILVGKAPFYHISRKQTMKKIMNVQNQKINYPSTMSREARSFIEQLLRKNPEQRLKSQDLLNHPFLRNVDNK